MSSDKFEDNYEAPEVIGYLLYEPEHGEGQVAWRWAWDKNMDGVMKADVLKDLLYLINEEYEKAVSEMLQE